MFIEYQYWGWGPAAWPLQHSGGGRPAPSGQPAPSPSGVGTWTESDRNRRPYLWRGATGGPEEGVLNIGQREGLNM